MPTNYVKPAIALGIGFAAMKFGGMTAKHVAVIVALGVASTMLVNSVPAIGSVAKS